MLFIRKQENQGDDVLQEEIVINGEPVEIPDDADEDGDQNG